MYGIHVFAKLPFVSCVHGMHRPVRVLHPHGKTSCMPPCGIFTVLEQLQCHVFLCNASPSACLCHDPRRGVHLVQGRPSLPCTLQSRHHVFFLGQTASGTDSGGGSPAGPQGWIGKVGPGRATDPLIPLRLRLGMSGLTLGGKGGRTNGISLGGLRQSIGTRSISVRRRDSRDKGTSLRGLRQSI